MKEGMSKGGARFLRNDEHRSPGGIACAILAGFAALAISAGVCTVPAMASESSDAEDSSAAQEATPFSSANTIGYTTDGGYRANISELPDIVHDEETNAQNAIDNQPSRHIDANGFTIQPVPSDPDGYNITYLNADKRGCNACHTMEDVMLNMKTFHGITFMGYPTEQNFANCFVCHQWATPLRTSVHAIHNFSDSFKSMGGTCESCHYIDNEGNFVRWDYYKYDLYKGYTDIAADDESAQITVSYDQDTLTSVDQMFYKSIKQYGDRTPGDWRTDDSNMDPELYNNWVITIGGDVENPIEMTLPELVDQFGTKTVTMKEQCTINGVGNAVIYQVEATGIPVKAILDYVQPKDGANAIEMHAEDYYPNVGSFYNMPLDIAADEDTLLVTEVNGQTLPNSQGYPVSIWFPRASAGECVRVFTGFDVITTDEETAANGYFTGDFTDPVTGEPASKPNSAVLNFPTGVVQKYVEGQPVELEGFADAWNEPIEKVEFSLDGGDSWLEMDTPDNDPERWTYWRLSFVPPNEGAYLLTIRTTSIKDDGTERTCTWNTQFLINLDADFEEEA
jgi:DMSO/TMAO reductase YedYZ molybdopterin-dependent catalytic subunit